MTNYEKAKDVKNYIQAIIDDNSTEVLGKRAVLNTAANEKISTITRVMSIPANEEIIIFFDDSFTGSGKAGLVISSWGLRYKSGILGGGKDGKWDLSWEELYENYTLYSEGAIFKKLVFRKEKGGLFTAERRIDLTQEVDSEWLERIIKNSCKMITGKEIPLPENKNAVNPPLKQEGTVPHVQNSSSVHDTEPAVNNKAPQNVSVEETAKVEKMQRKSIHEYNKARDYYENLKSAGGLSFFQDNITGIIIAAAFVFVFDIAIISDSYVSGGQKILWILSNIVQIPFGFVGYLAGNALRKALHPDFVIASGFWGLLKEKIFWRIGPQLIGALIGIAVVAGLISMLIGVNS
jgi:hypothetical protein